MRITTFAAAVLVIVLAPASRLRAKTPNILFILVDDLGWADIGSFGSKLHETPNIDRLEKIQSSHNP